MSKPTISIICALSDNGVIGKDNKLPWHISADLKRFKQLTLGHPVIMGRKTFESIGKPLQGRTNIVITRDQDYRAKGVAIAHSLDEALDMARAKDKQEIFIIGGAQVFEQSLSFVDKLYLTIVHTTIEGDAFFPEYGDFKQVLFEKAETNEKYNYTFIDLIR